MKSQNLPLNFGISVYARKCFLFSVFALFLFSIDGFTQGETACTAVIVQPGTYTADGPSSGGGVVNSCSFPIPGTATNADWYKYTPPANGTITIGSCLGGADTRLSLFTGFCFYNPITGFSSFIAGDCLAYNDDACLYSSGLSGAFASKIENFAVTGGSTYYIQWDNRWSSLGFNWSLEYTPAIPTNDSKCAASTLLCGVPKDGTTYGATATTLYPTCANGSYKDVFYKFNAFTGSTYTVTVNGSDYDGVLALYSGSCSGTLNQLACADNGLSAGLAETITYTSPVNQTILIQTYDYSTTSGNFTIELTCSVPSNDECADATNLIVNGPAKTGNTSGATASTNLPVACGIGGDIDTDADVWFKFNAPNSGKLIIETVNAPDFDGLSDSQLQIFDACGGEVL